MVLNEARNVRSKTVDLNLSSIEESDRAGGLISVSEYNLVTPLSYACMRGDVDMVRLLMGEGARSSVGGRLRVGGNFVAYPLAFAASGYNFNKGAEFKVLEGHKGESKEWRDAKMMNKEKNDRSLTLQSVEPGVKLVKFLADNGATTKLSLMPGGRSPRISAAC